jgi:glutathione synthase/RimK-type ligase-like ATP-grasp enzyme
LGFAVPETLITTDPGAAAEFWERHDKVVYKSLSGVRSIVAAVEQKDLERLGDVRWCPTQFQEYVPGIDYRVHVIGEEAFACRIMSDADDYRYASRWGARALIEECDLPEGLTDGCKALAAAMDLAVVGVDLRCTPQGKWYCFEVNPSPGFTYYQDHTQQPLDRAIARLLTLAE